ncbi:AP-1 complex subunit mu-2 [Erpetoichthys calabaricus]|uniref:AP-1 complex subunit mu-2 n=1 Tax=Erpetoichthys calabaricus TaxID=27687 RepID=UPI002234C064|nr:AP-1 complex subunit mu-2 [Erpetoichthys calabaricus]
MSASAVFILDLKGKVLIYRDYKGDVSMSEIDFFMPVLMQQEEEGLLCPLISHGKVHFLWIKHSNLYLVAATTKNSNASLVYTFLYKLVEKSSDTNINHFISMKNYVFIMFPRVQDIWSSIYCNSLSFQVKPLIWIESVIEKFSHSRVEIMVKAKGQFKKQSVANSVEIMVPVPSDADTPRFKTSVGSAKYVPEKNVVVWTIKSFPGGKEFLMRAHFGLPSVEKDEEEGRPPITVNFEIPYFTVSGIQVRYMKIIEKSGYHALPWVRYITQSGDYQLRTNA